MPDKAHNFTWHCRRMGGTDQVTLSTMAELRRLRELDPKLWGALSCPATGVEFDQRTMSLLDSNGDGRIRMPEVLDAVKWLAFRLKDTADPGSQSSAMPLAAIDTGSEAGRQLLATARTVLTQLGRPDDEELSQEDVAQAMTDAAGQSCNGDGVFPPVPELDDAVRAFVSAGLAIVGGARDASGAAGLNRPLAEALVQELENWLHWRRKVVDAAPHPVPETDAAWALLEEIRPKVDDFFLRCSLAAFAPRAETPLNAEERLHAAINPAERLDIDAEALAALPLARVAPEAALPLKTGLNPIWRERVQRFARLVAPLLQDAGELSESAWKAVQAAFAPYGTALAARPEVQVCEDGAFAPPVNPAAAIDALGEQGVQRLLDQDVRERFLSRCEQDLGSSAAIAAIAELERLVLYFLHLHRLLMNFVSFHDFYALRPNLLFRAGTLYLDGRSCQLCVPVEAVEAHSKLAAMSQMCLLYCECTRRDVAAAPGRRTIMAAMTAGDDDVLVEGRNGVFVDNTGGDWDATLVKIVRNPISFRQAVWAPYKRISRFIGAQLEKFAANKDQEGLKSTQSAVTTAATPRPGGQPFDMGRNVGIFAAVGIALGALGTAAGSIAQALFALHWWQFPLLLLGIFLVISGPSVFMAWLKFRKRTLGPVLEASGWAVNSLLPINIRMGRALTAMAVPPPNIERQAMLDPFRDDRGNSGCLWLCLLLTLLLGAGYWLWQSGSLDACLGIKPAAQVEKTVEKKAATAAAPPALESSAKTQASAPAKAAAPKPAPPKAVPAAPPRPAPTNPAPPKTAPAAPPRPAATNPAPPKTVPAAPARPAPTNPPGAPAPAQTQAG